MWHHVFRHTDRQGKGDGCRLQVGPKETHSKLRPKKRVETQLNSASQDEPGEQHR